MKRSLILCAVAGLALAVAPASSGAPVQSVPQVLCVDKHNDLT